MYASIAFCLIVFALFYHTTSSSYVGNADPTSEFGRQQCGEPHHAESINAPEMYLYSGSVLSEEKALPYCANYRLNPLPREKAAKRKIYDLLLFNTELDMLDIRLGQMAPAVDYFVILEGNKTFTNKDKPLLVQDNWSRYKPYHSKMIRRTMDFKTNEFKDSWTRENAIRNAMYDQVVPFLTGDQAPQIDDVLLVSDLDELFKPEILTALRNCDIPQLITAESRMYYYSFQWLQALVWPHPQATLYKGPEDTIRPDDVRYHGKEYHVFPDAGWHCSYCFRTMAEMVKKIGSFSHTELDKPEYTDPLKIIDRVRRGSDM